MMSWLRSLFRSRNTDDHDPLLHQIREARQETMLHATLVSIRTQEQIIRNEQAVADMERERDRRDRWEQAFMQRRDRDEHPE